MAIAVIIVGILAVVAGILLAPVRLEIRSRRNLYNGNSVAYLKILWFRIPLAKQKNTQKKTDSKPKEKTEFSFSDFQKKFQDYTGLFHTYKNDFGRVFSYAAHHAARIENIEFVLDYGFEDPMYTGIAMGMISGAAYSLLAFLTQHLPVLEHKIDIRPDFDIARFQMQFRCIVRLQNVHIMVIAIKALRLFFRIRKAQKNMKKQKGSNENGRTSN